MYFLVLFAIILLFTFFLEGIITVHSRPAETEATCIWKVSPQIVVEMFFKVCIMKEAVFVRKVKSMM